VLILEKGAASRIFRPSCGRVLLRVLVKTLGLLLDTRVLAIRGARLLSLRESVASLELFLQLLLEMLLNLALGHQRQVVKHGRSDAHFFKLLFGVGLDREGHLI